MAIPQLETCCCGCSLKTGTKIIGWLSLIGGILLLITFGAALASLFYIEDHPTPDTEEIRKHLPALKAITIVLIVKFVFSCVLSFILLLGTYQNKAKLIWFWVVATLAFFAIGVIVEVVQMLTVFQTRELFSTVLGVCIELYFILVVYSFYREISNVSSYP